MFEWSAQWIWGGEQESPRNEWRCFRKSFEWEQDIGQSAMLRITADSRYVIYINGQQAGRGPVRSWPKEQFYDTYEVGHLLKRSEKNTIAVLVLHFGVSNFYYLRGQGGLLAELAADSGPGQEVRIATDETWLTSKLAAQDARAPRMSCQQGFAEVYDARQWDEKWSEPAYDDKSWQNAHMVAQIGQGPWKSLIERDIPFLTEEKLYPSRLLSLSAVRPPKRTFVIDLRNQMVEGSVNHANPVSFSGYLAFMLALPEPGVITLGFPNGYRTGNIWVDGVKVEAWQGEQPEYYGTLELEQGEHFVLIDITSTDHGHVLHLGLDSEQPFTIYSPMGGDEALPFITIGPFDVAERIDHQKSRKLQRDVPEYVVLQGAASMSDLAPYERWIQVIPQALFTEQDVFGASVWRTAATPYSVPMQLQNAILPTPEAAVLPIFDGADCEIVIDLGMELSGYVGFELDAAAGTVIDWYGIEYMRDDYRQETYGLENTIRYICREGRQRYLSPVRRGLRYLIATVRGAARPVELHEVYMNQSNYPVTEAGEFQCSDDRLNEIWRISRHTTRLCMEDTFVDCPAYEQVFWVGDSRNEALVNYYVFGSLDIVKRCLKLVPGSADMTPLYVDQVPSAWSSVIPNWTFFWAIACLEYTQHTGDKKFIRDIWPAMEHTLEHYWQHIDEQGLFRIKGWNLLDWAPIDQPGDGVVTHQNLFLVRTLRLAAEAARLAGASQEKADQYVHRAQSLLAAINEHLWSEEKSAYLDCIHSDGRRSTVFSMQTQVVAYLCGAAEGQRLASIESYLLQPPVDFVQIGSPFMSFFYYEALEQAGYSEHMLGDMRQNFGQMVEHGATTCWEMYPNFKENRANPQQLTRSHCHAWSAAPGYFLGRSILGVKRGDIGWQQVIVEPQPCGLGWARGVVPLPQGGRVEASWKVEGERMQIRVSAPEGVQLDVRVPEAYTAEITRVSVKS